VKHTFEREVRSSCKSSKQGSIKRPWICGQITGNDTVAVGGPVGVLYLVACTAFDFKAG
jgi:hypothetical protein